MNPTNTAKAIPKIYGLVRDKDGNPKIDGDPRDLHPEIQALLTEEEKIKLGLK